MKKLTSSPCFTIALLFYAMALFIPGVRVTFIILGTVFVMMGANTMRGDKDKS